MVSQESFEKQLKLLEKDMKENEKPIWSDEKLEKHFPDLKAAFEYFDSPPIGDEKYARGKKIELINKAAEKNYENSIKIKWLLNGLLLAIFGNLVVTTATEIDWINAIANPSVFLSDPAEMTFILVLGISMIVLGHFLYQRKFYSSVAENFFAIGLKARFEKLLIVLKRHRK